MVWLTVAYSGADRLTVAYNDDLSESITPIMYVVPSPPIMEFSIIFLNFKIKKNMENSIIGGGVSKGHFPYPIFFIFFAPNGLKIIFRH